MFGVIELGLHLHKRWRKLSHRLLTSRASGICERQGKHYRTHPDDVFPKGFHLTYSDSASGPLALQVNYFFITGVCRCRPPRKTISPVFNGSRRVAEFQWSVTGCVADSAQPKGLDSV